MIIISSECIEHNLLIC